jgi:hypothetical protein
MSGVREAVALATAGITSVIVTHHFQHVILSEHEQEQRYRQKYRLPLHVPVGPQFDLDSFNEDYCVEFFRYVTRLVESCLGADRWVF